MRWLRSRFRPPSEVSLQMICMDDREQVVVETMLVPNVTHPENTLSTTIKLQGIRYLVKLSWVTTTE